MFANRSQRWKDRRSRFVKTDSFINTKVHHVDIISCHKQAKPFVEQHHYSGSFPATRLSCGIFRNEGMHSRLVGVACFSVSMNPHAGRKYTGMVGNSSVELGRLVLLDDVESNGESWFVSKCFSLLRQEKPDIEAVYAYSDPVPRIDNSGRIIMPGHVGEVYQALSAHCRGRATPRAQFVTPDGNIFSERTLSKIVLNECGNEYAAKMLLSTGVDERRPLEDPRAWIERLKSEKQISVRKHPGNWVYSFALTRKAKAIAKNLTIFDRPSKTGFSHEDVSESQKLLSFV